MNVNIIKMTGPELRKIYKSSGLSGDEFAEKLGISRGGLYLLFRDKIVSESIEIKIMQNLELNKIRQLSTPNIKSDISENQNVAERTGPDNDLIGMVTDTLQLMKDLVAKGERQTIVMQDALNKQVDLLQKSFNVLDANNSHIREEAELYRRMIMDSYDSGLLKWNKPGK